MVQFPIIEWIQQSLSVDPSGSRDLKLTGAGYLKTLGTGAGEHLDFGDLNITGSGAIAETKLVYARVDSIGDASGIFNMRFFLNNVSTFGVGTYRFLERKEFHFVPNLTLDSSADNTPTIVPPQPNFFGTITAPEFPLGKPWMSGTLDNDASQYVYLSFEAGVDVPVGTYGGPGAGTYRYRLLFDFS
jgi:hypothetical protein